MGRKAAIASGAFLLAAAIGCGRQDPPPAPPPDVEDTLTDDERAPIRVKNGNFRIETDKGAWQEWPGSSNREQWRIKVPQAQSVTAFSVTTYGTTGRCSAVSGNRVDIAYVNRVAGTNHTVTLEIAGDDDEQPGTNKKVPKLNSPGVRLKPTVRERRLQVDKSVEPDIAIQSVTITPSLGVPTVCEFPPLPMAPDEPVKPAMVEICVQDCQ